MFDKRIPYNGCSVRYMEIELATIKHLITKVRLMSKPKNFTYMDCANLIEVLETTKSCLEAAIQEKLQNEKN